MDQSRAGVAPPLKGCWAKIKRADHNIKRLDALIQEFLRFNPYTPTEEVNRDLTEYIYRVSGPPDPPLDFSVRAGEIIAHLRSSLDHLAWALVLRRHHSPTFRVHFPICTTVPKYKKAIRQGAVQGISGSAQAIIERTQPYHSAVPDEHPLSILHDLNNIDKHKLLLVVSSYTVVNDAISFSGDVLKKGEVQIVPENWSRRSLRAVEGGTELFRARFVRPTKVSMYTNLTTQIAFEEFGVSRVKPVIPSLEHLCNAVIKTLKLFSGEF
jgi:hypothetical protein